MAPLGWARSAEGVADVLRRGAWYRIVGDLGAHLVLEVGDRRVRLARADLQVRSAPPDHWSVVNRTGVLRPTLGGEGGEVAARYAVCPRCQGRQDLPGEPATLRCGRCGASAPIDWATLY